MMERDRIVADKIVMGEAVSTNGALLEVGVDVYEKVAAKLKGAIGQSCYYNGCIDSDFDDFYSTLKATLIVYRQDVCYPEGKVSEITDIVPVWWEYSTVDKGEGEILNDFCFSRLKQVVISM